jgi:hypothetical protein
MVKLRLTKEMRSKCRRLISNEYIIVKDINKYRISLTNSTINFN